MRKESSASTYTLHNLIFFLEPYNFADDLRVKAGTGTIVGPKKHD